MGGTKKATGIVRPVDPLGRVVIPVELRRTLGIKTDDSLEVFVDGDYIMLKNMSRLVFSAETRRTLYPYTARTSAKDCSAEMKNYSRGGLTHWLNIWYSKAAPLKGEVVISGAKNAVLPLMAAALLAEDTCVIRDVPKLRDVSFMKELLTSLGSEIEELEENVLSVSTKDILSTEAQFELVNKMRASILVMGRCSLAKAERESRIRVDAPSVQDRLTCTLRGLRHSARLSPAQTPMWRR